MAFIFECTSQCQGISSQKELESMFWLKHTTVQKKLTSVDKRQGKTLEIVFVNSRNVDIFSVCIVLF